MKAKALALFLFLIFTVSCFSFASSITNGYFRLILHESTGRYSIFYLSNADAVRYEPLLSFEDPRTSYASVLIDGKIYRLGGKHFTHRYERQNGLPAFVFESENLLITQVFTPIKSANSKYANGVMITYTVENTGDMQHSVGFRILLDTYLGEKRKTPFITGEQIVTNETLVEGIAGERFWITRGRTVSLMGSIVNPVDPAARIPDAIHFANWKRLNDAPWKLRYVEGRSFTNLPFSVDDSAVCYYYDSSTLNQGASFTYSIVLSTEDVEWYNDLRVLPQPSARQTAPARETPRTETAPARETPPVRQAEPVTENVNREAATIDIKAIELDAIVEAEKASENVDTVTLRKFQEILNKFIAGEIHLNEQDLIDLEKAIDRYR